ncbi:hypothetical protein [Streptomyces sp. NPDC003554]
MNASEVVAARAMAPSYAYIGMRQRRVVRPHRWRGCPTNDRLELSGTRKTAAPPPPHRDRAATVVAVDTLKNKVIATIPVGQQPQQLLYVPRAVPRGPGNVNLLPLGVAGKAGHLTLSPPKGSGERAHATVSVNALGALDLLQIAATGLKPGRNYTLWLTEKRTAPFGRKQALTMFTANAAGAQIGQAVGLLREVLTPPKSATSAPDQRYLVITPAGSRTAVAVQDQFQPMPPPEGPSPEPAPAAGGS